MAQQQLFTIMFLLLLQDPLPYFAKIPTADVLVSSDEVASSVDDDQLEIWERGNCFFPSQENLFSACAHTCKLPPPNHPKKKRHHTHVVSLFLVIFQALLLFVWGCPTDPLCGYPKAAIPPPLFVITVLHLYNTLMDHFCTFTSARCTFLQRVGFGGHQKIHYMLYVVILLQVLSMGWTSPLLPVLYSQTHLAVADMGRYVMSCLL